MRLKTSIMKKKLTGAKRDLYEQRRTRTCNLCFAALLVGEQRATIAPAALYCDGLRSSYRLISETSQLSDYG